MTEGFLSQITCSISSHRLSLAGFGTVDDVDLCITLTSHNHNKVVMSMQNMLRMWTGLLHAMGVMLVPEKSL